MAFWDNLTQKASQTTAKAVQKAKDLSEVAKLNSLITSEEGKINNTYSQIGKLYMSLHLQDYEDEFSGMINSIIESERKNSGLSAADSGYQRSSKVPKLWRRGGVWLGFLRLLWRSHAQRSVCYLKR